MGKVAGAVAVTFMVSAGAMGLLGGMLGAHAESAAVVLMGLGMVASSQVVGGKLSPAGGTQTPAPQG